MTTDNKISHLRLVVDNACVVKPKTCRTCYHFNPETFYEFGEEVLAGCLNDKKIVTKIDPVTNCATSYRGIVATDAACMDCC